MTSAGTSGSANNLDRFWSGWVAFAGAMMILLGFLHIVEALTALIRHNYFHVTSAHLAVKVSYTTWGWVQLILGAVVIAAGFGVLMGQLWARIIGIAAAAVSGVTNMAFISAYPFWMVSAIVLDVIVIYALAVHGGELESEQL